MKSFNSAEKDNMFVEEIAFNYSHSKIGYDHCMRNDYEESMYQHILNENLRMNENEVYIEISDRIFDSSY